MFQDADTCAICLDTLSSSSNIGNASAGSDMLTLHCMHSYHRACIAQFLTAGHAYDHDHRQLSCPKCKADEQLAVFAPPAAREAEAAAAPEEENLGYITHNDISILLQSGHLSKHQQSSITRQSAEAADVIAASTLAAHHCVRCNAHLQVGLQPDTRNNGLEPSSVTCRHCQTKQCGTCGMEWSDTHAGVSCSLFKARQQHAAADPASRKLLECSLPCPGCGHAIIKVAGCNKVRCAKCKTLMCWNCGERLPPGRAAYAHFGKEGPGTCRKYAAARPSWVAEGVDYKPERQGRPQKQQQTSNKGLNKAHQKQEMQQRRTEGSKAMRTKRRLTATDSDDEWTPKQRKRT